MSRCALARMDMFGPVVTCFSMPQHVFYESQNRRGVRGTSCTFSRHCLGLCYRSVFISFDDYRFPIPTSTIFPIIFFSQHLCNQPETEKRFAVRSVFPGRGGPGRRTRRKVLLFNFLCLLFFQSGFPESWENLYICSSPLSCQNPGSAAVYFTVGS